MPMSEVYVSISERYFCLNLSLNIKRHSSFCLNWHSFTNPCLRALK